MVLVVRDALANRSRRAIREKSVRSSRATALVSRYHLTHEWVFSKQLIHYVSLVAYKSFSFRPVTRTRVTTLVFTLVERLLPIHDTICNIYTALMVLNYLKRYNSSTLIPYCLLIQI